MITVAALYVDPRGVYSGIPGVGRTLKALLDSKPSDTPKDTALRALGANANIDPDHIDTLIGKE